MLKDFVYQIKYCLKGLIVDFKRNEKNKLDRSLIRILSFLSPRFFLKKEKKMEKTKLLQKDGIIFLSDLDLNSVEKLSKKYLDFASEYYNSNFNEINNLKDYMELNEIQRSRAMYLNIKSDSLINEILLKYKLSSIAKDYFNYLNDENLEYTVKIWALGKVNKDDFEKDAVDALHFHRDFDHWKFLKTLL